MSANESIANLVAARGRRASATILGWMEKNVYMYIPEELQDQVRTKILDNIHDLSDLAIDIVKSEVDPINEFWAEELDKLHRALKRRDG